MLNIETVSNYLEGKSMSNRIMNLVDTVVCLYSDVYYEVENRRFNVSKDTLKRLVGVAYLTRLNQEKIEQIIPLDISETCYNTKAMLEATKVKKATFRCYWLPDVLYSCVFLIDKLFEAYTSSKENIEAFNEFYGIRKDPENVDES